MLGTLCDQEASPLKVPVLLALGKREVEERKVSIRRFGSQQQTSMTLDEALDALAAEAIAKGVLLAGSKERCAPCLKPPPASRIGRFWFE